MADIKVQVCLFAFDCLYLNGDMLLQRPLTERRAALQQAVEEKPGELQYALFKVSAPSCTRLAFAASIWPYAVRKWVSSPAADVCKRCWHTKQSTVDLCELSMLQTVRPGRTGPSCSHIAPGLLPHQHCVC